MGLSSASPSPLSAAATASPLTAAAAPPGRASSGIKFLPRHLPAAGILRFEPAVLRNPSSWRLRADLTAIEPDLVEDKHDRWRTNGVSPEDFKYGEYDGHHTYHGPEGQGDFWGTVAKEYEAAEPPTGFQAVISWLFLPAIFGGMAFHVPGEYLYIGAAVFTVVFCIIEMAKPDKPHNFEPEIYNMDREARDKLIKVYNTMDVWDFNEKYGELWDFTLPHDDIIKQLKSLE
uniref:NAD(P)H dehydrogenase 18 n=1 Tax=Cypripedium formosanum TaxID=53042 RepID=A0A0F7GZ06_9ASPA